jgi:hypothetical protein
MGKIFRVPVALYSGGFKALSLFAPLLSIAFTIAKPFDAVSILRDISYASELLPITIWLLVAYTHRLSAFDEAIEAPRAPATSLSTIRRATRAA